MGGRLRNGWPREGWPQGWQVQGDKPRDYWAIGDVPRVVGPGVFGPVGEQYVAEGYFVFDYSAVQNYIREIDSSEPYKVKYDKAVANLLHDHDYILTEGGDILTLSRNEGGYKVDTSEAPRSFQNWLTLLDAYNTTGFDFAIHWTGLNLIGGGNSIAHVGTICDGINAVGVAEFAATYREVLALAHSLGYLLGANNDGAASSHVMAMSNKPDSTNRWTYSSNSASSMMDSIQLLNNTIELSRFNTMA
ncbi:hypothetical protein Btru_058034 [Bulinus truncatus]|nr:hypothetical protein Btru_058034 [Bulinus truncatus]